MAPITKMEGKIPNPRESVSGMSVTAMGLQKKMQGDTEIAVYYLAIWGKVKAENRHVGVICIQILLKVKEL